MEHHLGDRALAAGALELDEHVDRARDVMADVVAAELGAGLQGEQFALIHLIVEQRVKAY